MKVGELANMKYGANVIAQLQTNNNTFLIKRFSHGMKLILNYIMNIV